MEEKGAWPWNLLIWETNERLIPSLTAQNPVCLRSMDLQMSSLRSCREFNSSGENLIFPVQVLSALQIVSFSVALTYQPR